jgi:hypothetical protein
MKELHDMLIWLVSFISPLLLQHSPALPINLTGTQQYCFPGNYTETTKSLSTLPSFLVHYEPEVKNVYKLAAAHTSLLQWIPCYCGCGQRAGHANSKDCFIQEIKESGEVVWDTHAAHCVTCLDIAKEASLLQEQGQTILEIRHHIDTKYKNAYAKPTPTPMPQ